MRLPSLRPTVGVLFILGMFGLTIYKWCLGQALDRTDLAILIGGSVGLGVATITSAHQLGVKVQTLRALVVGLFYGWGAAFLITIPLSVFNLGATTWLIVGHVIGGVLGGYLSYWDVVRPTFARSAPEPTNAVPAPLPSAPPAEATAAPPAAPSDSTSDA